MIGEAPKFTDSEFFVADPMWHLKEGASEKEKRELEAFMNAGQQEFWKGKYPKMKKPYYTWSGKVIDRG